MRDHWLSRHSRRSCRLISGALQMPASLLPSQTRSATMDSTVPFKANKCTSISRRWPNRNARPMACFMVAVLMEGSTNTMLLAAVKFRPSPPVTMSRNRILMLFEPFLDVSSVWKLFNTSDNPALFVFTTNESCANRLCNFLSTSVNCENTRHLAPGLQRMPCNFFSTTSSLGNDVYSGPSPGNKRVGMADFGSLKNLRIRNPSSCAEIACLYSSTSVFPQGSSQGATDGN
mmetsp:Transcript_27389/g.53852  ORF Transcript_27389/g.53852 Transcript_27389/m.53852 type:complete len:231 (-) Transcript_27389:934-1626(-)